jgi:hypothetical protein
MDLTKRETQVLILAIGAAIERETNVLNSLKREIRQMDTTRAISERTKYVVELGRLRDRLNEACVL